MHGFSYDGICDNLPSDIVELIASIREANTKDGFRRMAYKKGYSEILSIAKLASVKYSNEIENIVSTDDRIRDLILRGGRPLTHTEEEISGYGVALDIIHSESLNVDKPTMHRLHSTIRAGLASDRGHFKTRDNAIVSVDKGGNSRMIMRTVPYQEVEENIDSMLNAYLIAESIGTEPLVLIPCLIVDYLCIHPYMDGNGRTSRLLTYLLLYQHGMDVCRYVSLDEHIAATKDEYYKALNESSQGWGWGDNTYIPFVRYFLRMLLECYMDLDTRFAMKSSGAMKKKERIELILKESLAPMSKRQIQKALPDISIHTVDSVIKKMLEDGRIEKIGGYKDARYIYRYGNR